MNYTIAINRLRHEDVGEYKDVVTHVEWSLTSTSDDGFKGVFRGSTPIEDLSQLDTLTFIKYEDLKESEIISWIESVLNENPEYREHIYERVADMINTQKRNIKDTKQETLPWLSS